MQGKQIREPDNIEITSVLTSVTNNASVLNMPTVTDVWRTLEKRFMHQRERVIVLRAERDKLRGLYEEYRDMSRELENRTQSMKRISGLIGPTDENQEDIREMTKEELGISVRPEDLRKQLALWEVVYEYLTCVDEAQVDDVRDFMAAVGMKVSRSAIESALKTHTDSFQIIRRGRQKWITLKKGA